MPVALRLPDCSARRGGHSVVTVGHELWAMGGWDNSAFQDAVDIYDSKADKWRPGKRMKTPRAYFAAAHLDGLVYALSGMQERQVFLSALSYTVLG